MKKILIYLLVFAFLLLASCTSSREPRELFSESMTITARLNGSTATFCAYFSAEGCDIVFDKDHILFGTSLHFGKDKSTATVYDFTREIKKGCFPAHEMLIKAVKLLASTEENGVWCENGVKYTIDEMTIMVYYEKDAGAVTGIETEENGRRFGFTVVSLEPYEAQSNGQGRS